MAVKEIRFSQSAILKILKDIFGAASPVGATSTTSDDAGVVVRNPEDLEKLERWDEIALQFKRMHLHLLFLTEEDGIEQNTIPNKIILKSSPAAAVEGDEDLADLLHVRDEKADGTAGGTLTGGTWNVRDLNATSTNDITGASLGSNQITLPAGTYSLDASAISFQTNGNHLRLYDTTASATLISGLNSSSSAASSQMAITFVKGRFTLTVQSVLELQHWAATTASTNGAGVAISDTDELEVYSEVLIRKIA